MRFSIFILIIVLFSFIAAACGTTTPAAPATATTTSQTQGPIVIINSPASNSAFADGDPVRVESTSSSANGIVLVELLADGRVVQSSPTPNGQPQTQFSVIQNWTAVGGEHTLTVRATDNRALTGQALINVTVSGGPPPTSSQATIVPPPTIAPPTAPPTSAPPATCTLNSTFAGDVTIPDGTVIAPGGTFVKTWALQNSGTCDWGPGFNIVFTAGSQLSAPSPSPIPATPAGQVSNISLTMVAPTQPGTYRGDWQLQAPNGSLFGTKVDVLINVPGAPTPIPPTPIPPTPPPAQCTGSPQISSFSANPSTIQTGQTSTLNWGVVTNATSVSLVTPNGSGGVATPGQIQVQPGSTTSYTLIAYCYNNSVQSQVTVNVQGAPPPPTPAPTNPNQIRSIEVERSGDNYKVTVQYYWNGDDAPAVIRAVGVSSGSDPVTNQGEASIEANHVKYVIINLTGQDAATIDVCMQGKGGQDLACSSKPV
jgi:hypothetical protein